MRRRGRPRLGSLESLRELNRLRVIDTLLERGLVSRAEIARRTGLSRTTVSSLVADLQAHGLVPSAGTSSSPAPRAAGPASCWRSTARRASRSASTSATRTCGSRSPTSPTPCSPRPSRRWTSTPRERRPGRGHRPGRAGPRRGRRRARSRAGRGDGPARADRRSHRHGRIDRDPPRLGRSLGRRGDGGAPRPSGPRRQRRQPRRARRGALRRRARARRHGLSQGLLGHRRGDPHRRAHPPRLRGDGGRDRARRSSTPTATSAGAGTAAAWRRSPPAPGLLEQLRRTHGGGLDVARRHRARARRRPRVRARDQRRGPLDRP